MPRGDKGYSFRGVDFFTSSSHENPNAERPSPLATHGSTSGSRSTETTAPSLAAIIANVMTQLAERIRLHGRDAQKGGHGHAS